MNIVEAKLSPAVCMPCSSTRAECLVVLRDVTAMREQKEVHTFTEGTKKSAFHTDVLIATIAFLWQAEAYAMLGHDDKALREASSAEA